VNALRRPGLRFLVEAVVIVLTAVLTGLMHLGGFGIAGAVAVVWVIVAVIEYSLSHPRPRAEPTPLVETLPAQEPVVSEAVRVLPRTPEPAAVEPEPIAAEPVAAEPEPVVVEPEPLAVEPEPVRVEPEPEPVVVEPEPEPEPVVVEPEPEPEPVAVEPEPEPEPEPTAEQAWNLWQIDRALRDSGAVTEEQEFLLMYLRDYAGPDGSLPVDFDALVRESFGDVLGTPAG
jgi:hypothetical protein